MTWRRCDPWRRRGVIDKDGTPLVVDLYGVYRLVNGALELVGPKPEMAVGNNFDGAVIAPDGGIWVRDGYDVQQWDGSKWREHAKVLGADLVGRLSPSRSSAAPE